MLRSRDEFPIERFVALARRAEAEQKKTTTIYNRHEALRHVRGVSDDGTCEVLCGKVWRSAYVERFGLGKIFVGSGFRRRS